MEKERITRFISKYTLSGLIESVKITAKDNTLKTSFIADDKSVIGLVKLNDFTFDNVDMGIYDTSKLLKMLSILDDDITTGVTDIDGNAVSLQFKDKHTKVNYMLAHTSVIPKVPDLKELPDWDVILKFDQDFISRFIKSKAALPDVSNFTILSDDSSGTYKVVLGFSEKNSNRIYLETGVKYEKKLKAISFSATYLREILVANKEAKEATLSVSSQGLAHISFEIDDFSSEYYLVEQSV